MPTPGLDCHISVQHAGVNGGVAVGFVCKADKRGPVVTLRRRRGGVPLWADQGDLSGAATGRAELTLTVLGLPRLLAPDGADYALSPAQVRARLDQFWAQTTPLTLTDALGSCQVMWAAGGIEERRYGDGAEFDLHWLVVG